MCYNKNMKDQKFAGYILLTILLTTIFVGTASYLYFIGDNTRLRLEYITMKNNYEKQISILKKNYDQLNVNSGQAQ